ncbi:SIS domain-containing protein [Rugosimonospora acidiphila]|uniref:SIS domain-containing protein n=1 Tax=Rugosimonospora acidiphila TaxID=556531 RepID=A0ABP9SFT3_9ACTN
MTAAAEEEQPGGVDALYPFLSAPRPGDPLAGHAELLAEVRRSTVDKAYEIIELRRRIVEREAARIEACSAELARAFASGARLLAFGNGGSSTDAQDLASLFMSAGDGAPELALPAFALTNDSALVTALSNDVGFEAVFARQIAALGRPGDIAVGLSTSGDSPNLLHAFDGAHARGLLTIGIAGHDGGKMAKLSSIDYLFVVDSPSVHRIQEAQTTIYHVLWELTLAALARGGPAGTATTDLGGTAR